MIQASKQDSTQKILGRAVRAARESQNLTLETLAARAEITYQYLSRVENGHENFSIRVLERLAIALNLTLYELVAKAFKQSISGSVPKVDRSFFRHDVPLPDGLNYNDLGDAMDKTQELFWHLNKGIQSNIGRPLHELIQKNNFSGLVSNIFSDAMDRCTKYKHNHHQRYPDLVCHETNTGLEIKATINIGKGGESHNGHSGWHAIICFAITDVGIEFLHVMFAVLNGHNADDPDWKYVGSKVNDKTGSRRTETYNTNLQGLTKLRDGSAYLNPDKVKYSRWRQQRNGNVPSYSIFAKP